MSVANEAPSESDKSSFSQGGLHANSCPSPSAPSRSVRFRQFSLKIVSPFRMQRQFLWEESVRIVEGGRDLYGLLVVACGHNGVQKWSRFSFFCIFFFWVSRDGNIRSACSLSLSLLIYLLSSVIVIWSPWNCLLYHL